jgi:predicted nucleic acid-binding protein
MSGRPDYNRKEVVKARQDNAELVKNSGRGMNKGDAIYRGIYLIDYKFTEAASFSVNLQKFQALQKQGWHQNNGMDSIMVAVFENHGGKAIAMIDWDLLREILEQRSIVGD